MSELYDSIYARNIGILSKPEQQKLRQATIGIAGVGGVGGLLAERLVRLGVGRLKITDPGDYEASNLNRQFSSSMLNVGKNKAESVFEQIKDINPESQIVLDRKGILSDYDARQFVGDCDLIADGMDFGLFNLSISVQRAARKKGIYYLFASALGFGALVAIFSPEGMTLEEYDKLPKDIEVEGVANPSIPLQCILPVMPSYAKDIDADTIKDLISGKTPGPSTSIGAGLASILAASEAMNIILKKRAIAVAPEYTYIDLLDRAFIVGKMG